MQRKKQEDWVQNKLLENNFNLPLLSFREKFWLWATSGARLKVKCCLLAISSLSTALTVSITYITRLKQQDQMI